MAARRVYGRATARVALLVEVPAGDAPIIHRSLQDGNKGYSGGGGEGVGGGEPLLSTSKTMNNPQVRLFGLQFSVRRVSEARQETPTLLQRVQRLEIAHNQLAEHFAALQGAHMKLRNQFHGAKGGRPPGERTPLAEIPHGDKAALRRALGVVPGRPFNHQE